MVWIVGGYSGDKMTDAAHKANSVKSCAHIDIENSIAAVTPDFLTPSRW